MWPPLQASSSGDTGGPIPSLLDEPWNTPSPVITIHSIFKEHQILPSTFTRTNSLSLTALREALSPLSACALQKAALALPGSLLDTQSCGPRPAESCSAVREDPQVFCVHGKVWDHWTKRSERVSDFPRVSRKQGSSAGTSARALGPAEKCFLTISTRPSRSAHRPLPRSHPEGPGRIRHPRFAPEALAVLCHSGGTSCFATRWRKWNHQASSWGRHWICLEELHHLGWASLSDGGQRAKGMNCCTKGGICVGPEKEEDQGGQRN